MKTIVIYAVAVGVVWSQVSLAANTGDNRYLQTPQYVLDRWDGEQIHEANRQWWIEQQADREAEMDFWDGKQPSEAKRSPPPCDPQEGCG